MRQIEHVTIDGLDIAFQRAGNGPPLVMLHGGFGCDSRSWDRQLDALSDEFTTVAWDAPGCGQSADPPETFQPSDFANCLATFIDALGLRRPHILGLSFGGAMALEFYRWHPGIPRTLVLAGAYAGWAGSLSAEMVEQRIQRVSAALDLPPDQWAHEWSPSMFSDSAPPELYAEIEALLADFHPNGQRTMISAFGRQDTRDVLARIEVPTLLLYGNDDKRSPLPVAKSLEAQIPGAQLVIMSGVGHLSNIEAPERFNAEVRRFLHSVQS